jgi:hypothetical protein
MLERPRKNIFWNQLFSVWQAPISRLAGRVGPTAYTLGYELLYDRSVGFCRHAQEGYKQSAGIKLLVNGAYEDEPLSAI